jgi:hypothetical protein
MATIRSYTTIEQSRKLADIMSLESADMHFSTWTIVESGEFIVSQNQGSTIKSLQEDYGAQIIPCWSLAALLKYLSEIKPQIYTPILFPSEGKWILQFVEYGHGNVCEVSCDNLVDACVTIIKNLHELKIL